MKLTNEHKEAVKRARARLANAGTSEGAKKGWETRRRGGALPAQDDLADPKTAQDAVAAAKSLTPAEARKLGINPAAVEQGAKLAVEAGKAKKEEPWPSWKPRTPGLREAIARVKPLGEQFGYHVNPNYEYETFPTSKQVYQMLEAGRKIAPLKGITPEGVENWKKQVGAYGVSYRQLMEMVWDNESRLETAQKKAKKLLAERRALRKKDPKADLPREKLAELSGHLSRAETARKRLTALVGFDYAK